MRRGITGGTGRRVPVSHRIARPAPLGPEHNPWFWNPFNVSAVECPEWFQRKLKEVDPDGIVKVIWNPVRHRWGVFAKAPKINHPVCRGWKLLFLVEENGEFIPLDERVLWKLFERSGRKWGNLLEYWLKVEQTIMRDREKADADHKDMVAYSAGEYYDYMKIKNIGKGSKFVASEAR
jgi:hypothetical protein